MNETTQEMTAQEMLDNFLDNFLVLDTETTGLDFHQHCLLELTYAVGTNDPVTLYVDGISDKLYDASPEALRVNKYLERFSADGDDEKAAWVDVPWEFNEHPRYESGPGKRNGYPTGLAWLNLPEGSGYVPEDSGGVPEGSDAWNEFLVAAKGKTFVGANPAFDIRWLDDFFYPERIMRHHRTVDIQAMAMGYGRLPRPQSFREIVSRINSVESGTADALIEQGKDAIPMLIPEPDHTSYNDVVATRLAFLWMYNQDVYEAQWKHDTRLDEFGKPYIINHGK